MTAWRLYPALLVLQICGCEWIDIISHIVIVCYLVMDCQPFPLTLRPPAASFSLLLLFVCAHITELRSFITRRWLLVWSLFVVLWLSWCFRTVLGDVSHFSAIVALQSSLLTNGLYIIHLFSYWKFPGGFERLLHLISILYILFWLQYDCHDFIQGCISHCLHLCFTNPFRHGFRLYMKAFIASLVARSGNTTTTLSN